MVEEIRGFYPEQVMRSAFQKLEDMITQDTNTLTIHQEQQAIVTHHQEGEVDLQQHTQQEPEESVQSIAAPTLQKKEPKNFRPSDEDQSLQQTARPLSETIEHYGFYGVCVVVGVIYFLRFSHFIFLPSVHPAQDSSYIPDPHPITPLEQPPDSLLDSK